MGLDSGKPGLQGGMHAAFEKHENAMRGRLEGKAYKSTFAEGAKPGPKQGAKGRGNTSGSQGV